MNIYDVLIVFIKELDQLSKNWTQVAPFLLDYRDSLAETLWVSTAEKIREYYLEGNQEITMETFPKLVQMLSDRFLVDVEAAIKLQSKVNKSPVYYYQFGYPGDSNSDKSKYSRCLDVVIMGVFSGRAWCRCPVLFL